MWSHVVAVCGLAALCAVWFLVQRWAGRQTPREHTGCSGCATACGQARELRSSESERTPAPCVPRTGEHP